MRLLGIDTSTVACAVGLLDNGETLLKHEEQEREHTRLLMPMIRSVLDEAGIAPQDLDAVVLGNGPGSFIGMRIAASVAQGLAFAAGIGIVPVSSLAVVAVAAAGDSETVAVTQDAHMQEVYLGVFRRAADGDLNIVVPERLQPQAEIPELSNIEDCVVAGAGWQRYPDLLEINRPRIGRISDCRYPSAGPLLALGASAWREHGAIAPEDVVPAYLRQQVAQAPAT